MGKDKLNTTNNDGLSPACQFVITADELIAAARALSGVPWRHQGRTRHGVDCGGFIDLATRAAGLDLQKYLDWRAPANYARQANKALFELTARYGERIARPCPGCVVLFKFKGEKHPKHYGIMTYNGNVIHADSKRGYVLEHGLRMQWAQWAHSFWKIPGVDYSDVSKPA